MNCGKISQNRCTNTQHSPLLNARCWQHCRSPQSTASQDTSLSNNRPINTPKPKYKMLELYTMKLVACLSTQKSMPNCCNCADTTTPCSSLKQIEHCGSWQKSHFTSSAQLLQTYTSPAVSSEIMPEIFHAFGTSANGHTTHTTLPWSPGAKS